MQIDKETMDLWFHYEEVAMHFNNLLMQYRLQLLGGAGAVGTIASYLIGGKVEDVEQRHWLRYLVSGGMFVLLCALASLDIFYYDRLLRGAVSALLDLEMKHPQIRLSTHIEAVVGDGKYAVRWVYASVLIVVGVFTLWARAQYVRERDQTVGR